MAGIVSLGRTKQTEHNEAEKRNMVLDFLDDSRYYICNHGILYYEGLLMLAGIAHTSFHSVFAERSEKSAITVSEKRNN